MLGKKADYITRELFTHFTLNFILIRKQFNPSTPTTHYKCHQDKVKVKGLGRKSSYLVGFSIFFMVLWKRSISWLKNTT